MKDEQSWLRFCLESECNSGSNNDNHNISQNSFKDGCISSTLVDSNENNNGSEQRINDGGSAEKSSKDNNDDDLKRILKWKRNLASTLGIALTTGSGGSDHDGVTAAADDNDNDDYGNSSHSINRYDDEEDDDDIEDTIRDAVNKAETERLLSERWSHPINVIPTADVLLQFDQVLTHRLIHYHINWLEET